MLPQWEIWRGARAFKGRAAELPNGNIYHLETQNGKYYEKIITFHQLQIRVVASQLLLQYKRDAFLLNLNT